MPLGPFNNPFGMASSPVLVGATLLLNLDGETDSYFLAIDKNTGKVRWRVERPEFTRGFSTPVIWTPPGGKPQALVAGSYQLTAYEVESGKAVWWVGGLTWQLKPTPVLGKDVIYIQNWAGGSDTGQQENLPPFEEMLKRLDANHDGRLSKEEIQDPKIVNIWREVDLDDDGTLDARELKGRMSAKELAAADPDRDGTLTKDEYLAVVETRFTAANPDKDGTLDAKELKSPSGRALLRLLK